MAEFVVEEHEKRVVGRILGFQDIEEVWDLSRYLIGKELDNDASLDTWSDKNETDGPHMWFDCAEKDLTKMYEWLEEYEPEED